MTVCKIDDSHVKEWEDYLEANEGCSIFHYHGWVEAIEKTYGYHPITFINKKDGKITAGLPFFEINSKLTGRRWISLPFTDYYDPLATGQDLEEILYHLKGLSDSGEAPPIEIRWKLPGASRYLLQNDVLHLLNLDKNYEKIEKGFRKNHIGSIKTALKNNVKIEFGQQKHHIDQYYHIHTMTRKRLGVPAQPKKFFTNLFHSVIEAGQGFVLLADYNDQYIAGAVFLHWKNTLTYKYGASLPDFLHLRPNNLILAEAIRWGCENDFAIFDMGKTDIKNSGLRKFKKYWGAEEIPLFYTHISKKEPKSHHSHFIEDCLSRVIRYSPDFVTRLMGELIYKDFA